MADENEPNIPSVACDDQTKSQSNGETEQKASSSLPTQQPPSTTINQPNQQLIFDDVCLTSNNKERSSTPSSYSSQDVGLSGSSTPLGTPFASNESLLKDLLGSGISVGDEDSDDHNHHSSSRHHQHIVASSSSSSDIRQAEMTEGLLFDLKTLEANYEAKMSTVLEEKDDLAKQVIDLKEKLFRQEEEFKRTVEDIKLTFNTRVEKCTKERDLSRKDLESMVVKYAKSERDVIVCKKAKDEAEKKMREAVKEREILTAKVKSLTCDKTSLMKSVDAKLSENILLQKEIEKVREELKDRDNKWKQAQSKIKAEIDDHHETCKKLGSALALIEDLQNRLKDLSPSPSTNESETLTAPQDRSRSNSRLGMINDSNGVMESTRTLPVPFRSSLKTSSSTHSLKDFGRESDDTMKSDSIVGDKVDEIKPELRSLKDKLIGLEMENHSLTRKIQTLERERLVHEDVVFKLKESLNRLNGEILECNMKLKAMDELQVNLQRQKEMVEETRNELSRVSELNSELTTEMESCRHKEGELLEFTERLTAKSVLLQADHNSLEEKYTSLLEDFNVIKKRLQELENENSMLNTTLTKERNDHEKEITLMARKVAEKMELVDKFKTRVEEVENENKVMKKRHLNSVRELNKELLLMKKHMETCENEHQSNSRRDNGNNIASDTVSNSSRSSSSSNDVTQQPPTITPSSSLTINSRSDVKSSSSLSTSGNHHGSSLSTTPATASSSHHPSALSYDAESSTIKSSTGDNSVGDILPNVDKAMLINKIFRLQKTIAKKQEKIDFLEEHNHQLLSEMKKKTKLIQNYILREEAGALTTNRMDENKKQLAKHGSTVMSSLYKSYPTDSAMTLNLSLEINRRLQAVLEDTILKNITLKENINTLGDEIAKLMQQKNSPGASTKSVST